MMDAKYRQWYEQAHVHGSTQAGLLSAQASEVPRYQAAVDLIGRHGHKFPLSVLDVGCGYGDLSAYCPAKWTYTGIDCTRWIAREGQRKYPQHAIHHLELAAFSADPANWLAYDVVVAIGVVATLEVGGLELFAEQVTRLARQGVVLTFYPQGHGYTGSFRSYAVAELVAAFKTPLLKQHCVELENGSYWCVYLPLGCAG